MAQFQTRPVKGLDKVDPVWSRIRSEAEDIAHREPELSAFIYENILHHDTLEAAVFATEELEETAKLYLLLRGLNPRHLSPEQVTDLVKVFGVTLPEDGHGH